MTCWWKGPRVGEPQAIKAGAASWLFTGRVTVSQRTGMAENL